MLFPSIFIPRVSCHNNEAYIESIFWHYFGGTETPILRIDLIKKQDARSGQIYQIAFVHFKEVAETESIQSLASQLENGESVKFVHNYPWFWILRKNTSKPKVRDMPRVLTKKDEAEIMKAQKEQKGNANRTTSKGQAVVEAYDAAITAAKDVVAGWNNYGVPQEEQKGKKRLPYDAEYDQYGEPMDPVYGTWW